MRPAGFVAAALLLAGCQPNVFRAEVKGESTVRGDPLGGLLTGLPIGSFTNLDFDQNQDFKNAGVSKDQVSSVKLSSVKLTIVSPNTQGFDFIDSLAFFAQANDQEVEVAHKQNISQLGLGPPNPTLAMDLDGQELRPYVTAPTMSIAVRGSGHAPQQDTTIRADVVFQVALKLF